MYLPPEYAGKAGPDTVLYLNHGGGDDDSKWTSKTSEAGGSAQSSWTI